jgi:hypothetical protein
MRSLSTLVFSLGLGEVTARWRNVAAHAGTSTVAHRVAPAPFSAA